MESFLDVIDQKLHFAFPDITLLVFGHIGDGNLHIAASTGGEQDKQKIYDIVYRATGEYQGSVTAEHGIGVLKKDYLSYSRNAEELALMRQLKATLDPKNILNAGRVIA
jgi:FAD/FMN-containing dehydrogenase